MEAIKKQSLALEGDRLLVQGPSDNSHAPPHVVHKQKIPILQVIIMSEPTAHITPPTENSHASPHGENQE